jgi:hypothetical protein
MPTSASRRVWEGKAEHYSSKNVKTSIALLHNSDEVFMSRKCKIPLARHAILYKNTVCSHTVAPGDGHFSYQPTLNHA